MDDRNRNERKNPYFLSKYSTATLYISNDKRNKNKYNDWPYIINKKFKKKLKKYLIKKKSKFSKDKRLINHLANQFVRETLPVFAENRKDNNDEDTNDFESIISCNWNNVRFKFPLNFDENYGFRMELRPMENPILNKEKAALIFFAKLMERMVINEELQTNFYIPISMV